MLPLINDLSTDEWRDNEDIFLILQQISNLNIWNVSGWAARWNLISDSKWCYNECCSNINPNSIIRLFWPISRILLFMFLTASLKAMQWDLHKIKGKANFVYKVVTHAVKVNKMMHHISNVSRVKSVARECDQEIVVRSLQETGGSNISYVS